MPRIAQRCQPEPETGKPESVVDRVRGLGPDALRAAVRGAADRPSVMTPAGVRFVDTPIRACDIGRTDVVNESVVDAWTRCTALRGLSSTGKSSIRASMFVRGGTVVNVDVRCAAVLLL